MTIDHIGIAGYARSGKDTVAQYLAMRYSHTHVSFADAIRDALVALNPTITVHHPETREKSLMPLELAVFVFGWEDLKDLSPDVRPLLQRFGSEVGRNLWGEDFWINRLFQAVAGERKVVISDVRYWNEAQAIRRKGGEVWWIERPGVSAVNNHRSENDLDNYDFDRILRNDGTADFLFDKIDLIMNFEEMGM